MQWVQQLLCDQTLAETGCGFWPDGQKDADQARRLLALASIYDGGSRADAARLGSVTVQIVRGWVVRFNARGPDGLINGKAPGKLSLLNGHQRAALAQAIEHGPLSRRSRALAFVRSGPVALGGIPCVDERADFGPRSARDGLPQTPGSPEISCAGCRGGRGV